MPWKPLRPCRTMGCRLVGTWSRGRCPEHERVYDRQRGTPRERGYDARHRRWRIAVLTRTPWCVDPEGRHCGVRKPAVHADHIDPTGERYDIANGQGLCQRCHSAKTAGRDGGFGNARR